MESFFARHKNATILAVVLVAQILGLATQIKRPAENGPVRLIRQWAVAIITPFERGFVHSEQWVRHRWSDYFYLRGVSRENTELRGQIERLRLERVRMEQDAAQARRIQALLQFKEQYISKTVAAQVIGSSGSETSHLIYIDRGSNEGIEPNMAVITPDGIVGKVLHVYPSTSQVLEITDQTSGVGATLVKSRLQGIVKGQSAGNPNLAYIMTDESVEQGEDVITSGGDRIFPKGLPIGKVASVSPGKDLFLNVRVTPAANLNSLEEVLVITQIVEKEPDTKGLGPIRAADILAQRLPSVPDKPAEAAKISAPAAAGSAPGATSSAPDALTQSHSSTGTAAAAAGTGKLSVAAPIPNGKPVGTGAATASKPALADKPSLAAPGVANRKPASASVTIEPKTAVIAKPAAAAPVTAGSTAPKPGTSPNGEAAAKPKSTPAQPAKPAAESAKPAGEDTP
jgi:rod shape-determining protein MreC